MFVELLYKISVVERFLESSVKVKQPNEISVETDLRAAPIINACPLEI